MDNIHRIFNTLTGILHTRLELIAIELEEEKKNILELLLMVGVTLIFTVFGVISLLIFILLSVSPEHRLIISGGASAVFLVIALFFVIFIKKKDCRKQDIIRDP
ncbi:phage holin family protein [Proteus mirabilis]|uniref:Phage holin family protein n=2 Tax=Proteus mirabilis TaxID=584 RepID=A0ABD5LXT7_PROMI